jgi:hypothetical protein
VLAALLLVGGALRVSATTAGAGAPQRLPDLDQEVPSELTVARVDGRYVLGFRSAVRNIGAGPLIIDGHRPGADTAAMRADQVIVRDGAPREVVRDVGRLRYVVSPDHRHWHLLRFQRYELRRPGGSVALARDRKTGFCLGDRYTVRGVRLPARAARPLYRSRCGLGRTRLLGIREGISVGYGDDYAPTLEGQYLPLTGLPDGDYVLVHRVAAQRIRETRHDNDAASVLLRLRRRVGVPYVRVLARCPDTASCPSPDQETR